jgi:hypothetical protein
LTAIKQSKLILQENHIPIITWKQLSNIVSNVDIHYCRVVPYITLTHIIEGLYLTLLLLYCRQWSNMLVVWLSKDDKLFVMQWMSPWSISASKRYPTNILWKHSWLYNITLRRRIKTHIIRYHTRKRMQTPQIKFITVRTFKYYQNVTNTVIKIGAIRLTSKNINMNFWMLRSI